MAEGDGSGEEAVDGVVDLLGILAEADVPPEEHPRVPHAEVAAEIVESQQVEVDEPRVHVEVVARILAVVAVGEAAVEGMVVALGVDRPVPGGLLEQHDLAV